MASNSINVLKSLQKDKKNSDWVKNNNRNEREVLWIKTDYD